MYNQKNHQFKTFYNHKFGFHLSAPQREACNEALKLRPKVLKTLDFSVDFLSRVRLEQPDTFIIGRLFVHPQEFGRTASDAQRRGVQLAERILRLEINRHSVAGQRIFNAWESLNEVLPEHAPDDQHKLYDEFQVAFGRRLRSAGFEAVGFNFATGNGRGEQWLRLYPGTLETYTYLGFHEYDWPELDRLHRLGLAGPVEPEHRVPAVGAGRGNDGMWRCLRYRRIMHEGIPQKYGDRHTVIITECGMT
ncbi:MAG TPA: hypothetical protein PKE64_21090, partial [Anaerolineae bacterium]|nr:hypothetical protein [Anaerolineae bacterium]